MAAAESAGKVIGKVKWFNESKGFGFIESNDGRDVFVHYTAIASEGFRTLTEGAQVEFTLAETDRGLQATQVQVVNNSESMGDRI